MPKIQGTQRTVQTNTVKQSPPSTAGFGSSGKAFQILGNAMGQFAGAFDAFAATQEKNDSLDASMRLLEFSMDQDQKQFDSGRSIDGDGRDHINRSLNRYDTEGQQLLQTIPEKQRAKANLSLLRTRQRIQNNAQGQQGQHQNEYWKLRGIDHSNNVIKSMVTPDALKTAGLDPAKAAMAVTDKAIDQMPISPALKGAMKETNRKRLAQDVASKISPEQYLKMRDAKASTQKILGGADKVSLNNAPDYRGKGGRASIRFNNPGAQWPGPSARKFGMTKSVTLKDGQNNKIAVFPTAVHGAAAHFDLLHRRYADRTVAQIVKRWSGGNHAAGYARSIQRSIGLKPNQVVTKEMLEDPKFAIPFAQAMAGHEAGKGYPMTKDQWGAAHKYFMSGGKGDVASYAARSSGDTFTSELFSPRNQEIVEQRFQAEQEQQFISGVMSGEVKVSGNDTVAMKRLNKVFNGMFGPETNFLDDERAYNSILQLAKNKAPLPKRFFDKMEGNLDSTDPAIREKAFQMMHKVELNNPAQFRSGSGADELGKKLASFRMLSEYYGPGGAVREMMGADERVSKMKADDLRVERNKFLKDISALETIEDAFDDHNDLNIFFGSDPTIGGTEAQKTQIIAEFKSLAAHEFNKSANAKMAKASALHLIKSRYSVSEFGGGRTVMKYAPELFVSSVDIPYVKKLFASDAKDAIDKWSPLLAKRGIKVVGDPILVPDEHTRRTYEAYSNNALKEETVLLMDGVGQSQKVRALPEWRIAVKVDVNGETGYRLLNEYFVIEGLSQQSKERVDEKLLDNKAKSELEKEGKYAPGALHNRARRLFGYEDAEVVNKKEILRSQ